MSLYRISGQYNRYINDRTALFNLQMASLSNGPLNSNMLKEIKPRQPEQVRSY